MKWFFLSAAVVLTVVFGLPFREFDTGKLLPIQSVQIAYDGETVRLVSEVGEGSGATWEKAVENLRENASGDVFFDTAEQVIFCGDVLSELAAVSSVGRHPQMPPQKILFEIINSGDLRPSAQIYCADDLQDTEGLSDYLAAHESSLTLVDLRAAWQSPSPYNRGRTEGSTRKGYAASLALLRR